MMLPPHHAIRVTDNDLRAAVFAIDHPASIQPRTLAIAAIKAWFKGKGVDKAYQLSRAQRADFILFMAAMLGHSGFIKLRIPAREVSA